MEHSVYQTTNFLKALIMAAMLLDSRFMAVRGTALCCKKCIKIYDISRKNMFFDPGQVYPFPCL